MPDEPPIKAPETEPVPHGSLEYTTPPSGQSVIEAIDQMSKILEEIDAGNVSATAAQRAFLSGAVYGLRLATAS